MNLDKFTGSGSTPSRRRFWNNVADAVMSLRKTEGRNVSIQEHQGLGTVINFLDQTPSAPPTPVGACCVGEDCTVTTQEHCDEIEGIYQGHGTNCSPNPCACDPCPMTDVSADFTFDADDGTFFFSGSGTVSGSFSAFCSFSGTTLVPITVHKHGGDDCDTGDTCHVSISAAISCLGGGEWSLNCDATMLDHSCLCDGSGWPPNSIVAALSTSFIGTTDSEDLIPTTGIIMNAHINVTLS